MLNRISTSFPGPIRYSRLGLRSSHLPVWANAFCVTIAKRCVLPAFPRRFSYNYLSLQLSGEHTLIFVQVSKRGLHFITDVTRNRCRIKTNLSSQQLLRPPAFLPKSFNLLANSLRR